MKSTALLMIVLAGCGGANGQGPKLQLESDGHACSGKLRTGAGHLYWKSSFSTCEAGYTAVREGDAAWTLRLKAGRGCGFTLVTVRRAGPAEAYAMWEVTGYASEEKRKAGVPELACNMQAGAQ